MDSGTTFGVMGRQHSPEEWEQQRSLIKRLYIDEKMPLPKLMLVMEESGFYATKKLYKNWIETWKLRKNLKLEEKKALLRKQRKRKMEENKETIFWMNGDVIPLDRLIRHEKETRKEEEEEQNLLDVTSSAADTPLCVCYQTPPGGSPKELCAPESEMFSNLQLGSPNRSEQTFACLACRRYEGLIAVTLKIDPQHQGQLGSILSELNRRHNNLDAMRSPRNYSQSLQGPIDASSQAATRAFMYLSEWFKEVKQSFVIIGLLKCISPELFLTLFRVAEILSQRDIPMAPEFMTDIQICTESLESHLELLELLVDILRSAFNIQTHILLELVVRAKSLSPQDPQETLRTLRELYCILNNEDASHLRGAVTSLRGLWKIYSEKERSHEKTLRLVGFVRESRALSLFLPIIFSHYQEGIRKTSLLHPWGQSDRARTLREQMKVSTTFE